MPFTPFHFGPGLLIKAVIPKHFSLSTFALANVAMDVEPLFHLLRGDMQLHGATHTFIGAGLIAVATAVWGSRAICHAGQMYERWRGGERRATSLTNVQVWLGAMLGTYSHVLMDAVMHVDVRPFLPFTDENPWLKISWTEHVYLLCVLAGMLGMLLLLLRAAFQTEGKSFGTQIAPLTKRSANL